MENYLSSLTNKLLKGEKVLCENCKKDYYKTKSKDVAKSTSFYCENCGDHINITPGNAIVE